MSCSCTEDFQTDGNITIGYNKVECQECQTTRLATETQNLTYIKSLNI